MNFSFINQHANKRAPVARLQKLLRHLPVAKIHGKKNLSIVFVDDKQIAKLSKQFGRAFHATDILTFPDSEKKSPLAGEIIISLDTARRQANEREISFTDELLLLIIHGVLHLQGFNDENRAAWKKMKEAEYKYFATILRKEKRA